MLPAHSPDGPCPTLIYCISISLEEILCFSLSLVDFQIHDIPKGLETSTQYPALHRQLPVIALCCGCILNEALGF